MSYTLHPQLAADTYQVAQLPLCDLLLMNDARYPWCILVPRLEGLRDLHEVPAAHKTQLQQETDQISLLLSELTDAYKMNVAALGNMVEQLHIHVIARRPDDAAWPGPVWGVGAAEPYTDAQAEQLLNSIRTRLG
jgi:diadenosine tetraphosphate (Ap4A) HIT family hydrolase